MRNEEKMVAGGTPTEISLVLFRAAGVKMGVDAEQVAEIMDAEEAERGGIPCMLPSNIFGGKPSSSPPCSKTLLHRGESGTFGLRIDELCEIKTVRVDSLRPLPELIASSKGPRKFWGTAAMGKEIVLLVDLRRLETRQPAEKTVRENEECRT